MGEKAGQVNILGHARLVQNDDAALSQLERPVRELTVEPGEGRRLGQTGACAQAASGLGGRGCADDLTSRGFERCRHRAEEVVFPAPATPMMTSAPRPDVQIASAAHRCSSLRPPTTAPAASTTEKVVSAGHRGASVRVW